LNAIKLLLSPKKIMFYINNIESKVFILNFSNKYGP
jgi:hypothetical protein